MLSVYDGRSPLPTYPVPTEGRAIEPIGTNALSLLNEAPHPSLPTPTLAVHVKHSTVTVIMARLTCSFHGDGIGGIDR
jgi:hypothetical protein